MALLYFRKIQVYVHVYMVFCYSYTVIHINNNLFYFILKNNVALNFIIVYYIVWSFGIIYCMLFTTESDVSGVEYSFTIDEKLQ